jgi:hypothetical protein
MNDPVAAELRKLREGRGLTLDRLTNAGDVLSALGTSNPGEGLERLRTALFSMGESQHAIALQVDFGIGLETRYGRHPHSRELEWLGDRREGYGATIKRDSKTLARWSNKAIIELRNLMLADSFSGHLYVVCTVRGNRISDVSLVQEPLEHTDGVVRRESINIPNSSKDSSIPALIYGFPRDWRPTTLTLSVDFGFEHRPAQVWGTLGANFFEIIFGATRYELKISSDNVATCRFERPRRDRLYAISWTNDATSQLIQ